MGLNGLNNFLRHIAGIDQSLSTGAKNVVKQNALEMEAKAKMLAPVGDTGNLKRSISTTITESSDGIKAEVSTNVEYAPHVEFGTSRQQAQPFFNPAYEAQKAQFESDMERVLRDGVDG